MRFASALIRPVNARLPLVLASFTLLLHALGNPHYGFFRDELYFIICGRHPAWGYVDQPPLTPLLAAASQMFGHSLFLLRLVAALCAAATVYVTCLFVAEIGGGAFAAVLASICVTFAPVLCAFGMKVGPDMLEMPLWPLAALFVLRVVKGGDDRWWLAAGVAIGIAFESKYSVAYFAVALLLGLLFTRQRAAMATKWFWLGLLTAAVIAAPNVLWQSHYGFPMLELLRNGQMGKNVILSPSQYLGAQLLLLNPLLALPAVAGLILLLREPALRWLGYGYAILLVAMIASHGKDYYPAAVYSYIFAAGGCAIERWTSGRRALRPVVAAFAVLAGMLSLPRVLPILPVPSYIAYQKFIHLAPSSQEHHRMRQLPQDYADMMGWTQMADVVASVYRSLPNMDRRRAAIFADNYGEASAIEFFGAPYALPPVLSGHNQYFLWGPQGFDGSVLVKVGGDAAQLRTVFGSVQMVAFVHNPMGMAYEDQLPVFVCRHPRAPLSAFWPKVKNYI